MKSENTQLAAPAPTTRPSALAVMANKYQVEPHKLLETLKQTAFKGASDPQMMALCIVANEFNLNPFTKEIYAFPEKGGGIVPVVGVDGWLRRVNEHDQFDGLEFTVEEGDGGKPESVTCTIYRKDRKHPCSVTEYLSECSRNTDPWNKSPRRMLRHRALIQCARVAFGFGGSDPEEAEQVAMRDVTPQRPEVNPFATARGVQSAPEEEKPRRSRPRKAKCDGNHAGPECEDPECWLAGDGGFELEDAAPDDPSLPVVDVEGGES